MAVIMGKPLMRDAMACAGAHAPTRARERA
jgi:hypothetical protein